MNGINSKTTHSSNTRTNNTSKHTQSVETAGSLAMNTLNPFAGCLSTPLMDMFSSSNPVMVNYAQYANCNYVPSDCMAAASGFLGGFESAVSTLGTSEGFSNDGSVSADSGFSGGDFGGFVGASCSSCSCGGFTSVC